MMRLFLENPWRYGDDDGEPRSGLLGGMGGGRSLHRACCSSDVDGEGCESKDEVGEIGTVDRRVRGVSGATEGSGGRTLVWCGGISSTVEVTLLLFSGCCSWRRWVKD